MKNIQLLEISEAWLAEVRRRAPPEPTWGQVARAVLRRVVGEVSDALPWVWAAFCGAIYLLGFATLLAIIVCAIAREHVPSSLWVVLASGAAAGLAWRAGWPG